MKIVTRLALVAFATMLAVLCLEGTHSLLRRRPWLLAGPIATGAVGQLRLTDAERAASAARQSGPFALHCDPGVAFAMRADHAHVFFEQPARSDAFGTRVRIPAGSKTPEPDAQARQGVPRIVLLGDSVTFGLGVADDATLAHQLEEALALALPSAPPVVFTLACPGWNAWNCARAFADHLGRLQPDIVVYTPVANDLYDSFATTEAGHRSYDFDPLFGGQRPHVGFEAYMERVATQAPLLGAADALALRLAGGVDAIPSVAWSGATPESRRRWREFTGLCEDMHLRMTARGGRFAVLLGFDDVFERLTEATLAEQAPTVPLLASLRGQSAADQLPGDPHPNARCLAARARVLADFLIAQQWLPGADARALPPLDPAYADRVGALTPAAERAAWRGAMLQKWASWVGTEIDLTRARGVHQIYGGIEADGTIGRAAWLALRADAAAVLELEFERLPVETALYPLAIDVRIGEHAVVRRAVEPPTGDPIWRASVPLPAPAARTAEEMGTGVVDVIVAASNQVLEQRDGRSRLAALRLRRAAAH